MSALTLVPARLEFLDPEGERYGFNGVTTTSELQKLFGASIDARSGEDPVRVYLCSAFDKMPVRLDLDPSAKPFIGRFGLMFEPDLDPHAVIASSAKKALEIGQFCLSQFKETPPSPKAIRPSPFRSHEV